MPENSPGASLHEQLARWVREGLIDAGQAARIEAAEAGRARPPRPAPPPAGPSPAGAPPGGPIGQPPAPGPPARRMPLVVEALGYVGGVLAIVAGVIAVTTLWPGIPTAAELAFAAVAAAALGVAGAFLRTGADPAFARLRGVLWLMSVAAVAAFMGVLAAQVWHLSPLATTLVSAAVATAYAVALWLAGKAPLQHLAMFAGAAVLAGAGAAQLWPGSRLWGPGLAVWLLSALWGAAVIGGYLPPLTAGYLAAGIGLLAGAELTMQVAAGHVLALATVAGLLVAGVAARRVWLLVLGAFGVLQVVPQTAARYLPTAVAAPLAVFVVGVVLLIAALWLARSRHPPRRPRHP